jgi:hypothetical protein
VTRMVADLGPNASTMHDTPSRKLSQRCTGELPFVKLPLPHSPDGGGLSLEGVGAGGGVGVGAGSAAGSAGAGCGAGAAGSVVISCGLGGGAGAVGLAAPPQPTSPTIRRSGQECFIVGLVKSAGAGNGSIATSVCLS